MDTERAEPRVSARPVVDPVRELAFNKAFAMLRSLVDFDEVERRQAVYATSVVWWMLVSQRLNRERVRPRKLVPESTAFALTAPLGESAPRGFVA